MCFVIHKPISSAELCRGVCSVRRICSSNNIYFYTIIFTVHFLSSSKPHPWLKVSTYTFHTHIHPWVHRTADCEPNNTMRKVEGYPHFKLIVCIKFHCSPSKSVDTDQPATCIVTHVHPFKRICRSLDIYLMLFSFY